MRILLAEDEHGLSRALCVLLERAGYRVVPVCNGRDALDQLERGGFDAAVLDITMPAVDGLELFRRLRRRGDWLPVLMLSAMSEVPDRVAALDMGANDYLTKPFSSAELLARVRAMTRRQGTGPTATCLTFGNITLDRAAYELSSPSGNLALSNRECQVMELLLRNPRGRIPSERFLELIWGYGAMVDPNIVWVYLSRLRKKLAVLHADIIIKCTRNAGYSLERL